MKRRIFLKRSAIAGFGLGTFSSQVIAANIESNAGVGFDARRPFKAVDTARVEMDRGVPMLVVNGQPVRSRIFFGGTNEAGLEQIRMAADAGIDMVSFALRAYLPLPGQGVDWSVMNVRCQQILDANPRAMLLPRIRIYVPQWWREAHPGDMMAWDQEQNQRWSGSPAAASQTYRRDAAAWLNTVIEHLEKTFGQHIIGYHPAGQHTGEWFYPGTHTSALNGYSPATQDSWRDWLRKRYKSDAALQEAWGRYDATLATVMVSSPENRRSAPAGTLRDPKDERMLIDFAEFQQDMMSECVLQLAHTARKATRGKKLVVFFYGYVYNFAGKENGPATSGHYALRRVLDCPDIDVLCSPIDYFDRGIGESGPAMTAAESVALANKLWLYEDDTATFLSSGTRPGWRDKVETIEETNALLIRNTAQCSLRNFGTWWMDLGGTGWFKDKRMWRQMELLKALDQPMLDKPRPFRPQVAAVVDERSMLRVAFGGSVASGPCVSEARRNLARSGAPYGQYLLDDVTAGRVKAKMYIFLNAWCLSPEQRERILEATRGTLRVWCYAPGYQEPQRVNEKAMKELTGFRLVKVQPATAQASPTENGHQHGLKNEFGVESPVTPLFAAADASPDETMATYADDSAAIALRKTNDGWSLFIGTPGLSTQILRLAADRAGVHLYTRNDCNVYANGPFVMVHASQDGPLEINFGRSGTITDLMSGDEVGQGPTITLEIKLGETRVFRIGSDGV